MKYSKLIGFVLILSIMAACSNKYHWISDEATTTGKKAHDKRVKELRHKQPGKQSISNGF